LQKVSSPMPPFEYKGMWADRAECVPAKREPTWAKKAGEVNAMMANDVLLEGGRMKPVAWVEKYVAQIVSDAQGWLGIAKDLAHVRRRDKLARKRRGIAKRRTRK
jgi:hypothetical protein